MPAASIIRCKPNVNAVISMCWTEHARVAAFAGRRLANIRAKLAGEDADSLLRHSRERQTMTSRMVLIWNLIRRSHIVPATNLDAAGSIKSEVLCDLCDARMG